MFTAILPNMQELTDEHGLNWVHWRLINAIARHERLGAGKGTRGCYASIPTLATYIKAHRVTTQRAMADLVKLGIVIREKDPKRLNQYVYRLSYPLLSTQEEPAKPNGHDKAAELTPDQQHRVKVCIEFAKLWDSLVEPPLQDAGVHVGDAGIPGRWSSELVDSVYEMCRRHLKQGNPRENAQLFMEKVVNFARLYPREHGALSEPQDHVNFGWCFRSEENFLKVWNHDLVDIPPAYIDDDDDRTDGREFFG
jgi:hypothetical protein